jgi:hypothetical protein
LACGNWHLNAGRDTLAPILAVNAKRQAHQLTGAASACSRGPAYHGHRWGHTVCTLIFTVPFNLVAVGILITTGWISGRSRLYA